MSIEEGQPAPAFTLQDQNGKDVSLSDLQGRDVVLYFYPKDDTPGCTKEACGFRDLWSDVEEEGVAVYGVSPDAAASHREFIAKYSLPFSLLSDPDHRMMERYGAWGEKTRWGIKSVGVIRSSVWIDPAGKVRKHWKQVREAAEHPRQVLEALRAREP